MKNNILHTKKFRHGSVSLTLTVLIIAAVVILNVIATALASRYSWMYADLTAEGLYTLSDSCIDLLDRSFVDIIKERGELNEKLPEANAEVAGENIEIAEKNVTIAEEAINTAKSNVEAAKKNGVLFAQSTIHAKRNENIASNNITIAKTILKVAKAKVGLGEDDEIPSDKMNAELELALENLDIAEENYEIAGVNLTIAGNNLSAKKTNDENEAYNRQNELSEGDEGYRPMIKYSKLLDYFDFKDVSAYEYEDGFDTQIVYENLKIAEANLENANKNLATAQSNLAIANANKAVADKNAQNSVIAGEDGYVALADYEKYLEYIAYGSILGFDEVEKFANPTKPAPYESEKSLYDEDLLVKIIFCDLEDNLRANETQNMVLNTALQLQEKFPQHVKVEFIDIWNNVTAVQKYKTTSYTSIVSTNVIIESGSEFRVISLRSFYSFNESTDETPWGYNGEYVFASAMLAVSQAESPIACVTINHTETFNDYQLFYSLESAGYRVQTIDLAYQDIPDDCRLVVIFNPKEDFMEADGVSDISEIDKLDRYLNGLSCSMMVFVDASTPKLPNLEEYLEEWGVVINRYTDSLGGEYNYTIKEDPSAALSTDGFTFAGTYVEKGTGASIYKSLTQNSYPPKVVFKNATSLSYSPLYTEYFYVNHENAEDETDEFWVGSYYSNGNSREIFDVFTTTTEALAMANGNVVKNIDTEYKFHKLMTLTRETRMIDNENSDDAYVLVCASTEFASEKLLGSAVYGNNDVILSAARSMGKEFVPVDLDIKPFASTEISEMTTESKNTYTAVLAIVPAVIVIGAGVFVLVRRKYS